MGVEATQDSDFLREILVEAILQKQSDTYIHTLLNSAVQQGTITLPAWLRTTTDQLDSRTLLQAMIIATNSDAIPTLSVDPSGTHVVATGESLAGIAQMYFGSAAPVSAILQANPALDPNAPQLMPGSRIALPKQVN